MKGVRLFITSWLEGDVVSRIFEGREKACVIFPLPTEPDRCFTKIGVQDWNVGWTGKDEARWEKAVETAISRLIERLGQDVHPILAKCMRGEWKDLSKIKKAAMKMTHERLEDPISISFGDPPCHEVLMDEHPAWWIWSKEMEDGWLTALADSIACGVPVEHRAFEWEKWFTLSP